MKEFGIKEYKKAKRMLRILKAIKLRKPQIEKERIENIKKLEYIIKEYEKNVN